MNKYIYGSIALHWPAGIHPDPRSKINKRDHNVNGAVAPEFCGYKASTFGLVCPLLNHAACTTSKAVQARRLVLYRIWYICKFKVCIAEFDLGSKKPKQWTTAALSYHKHEPNSQVGTGVRVLL
jgi:hypothetical protein